MVWWRSPIHPPAEFAHLIGERIDGAEEFTIEGAAQSYVVRLLYTVIAPKGGS